MPPVLFPLTPTTPGGQSSQPATSAPPKKLFQVAEQFETVLLNDLLGPLEKTFSSVPGETDSPGASDYQYLGSQALASTLAHSGGFGIAAMIVRNVMKHKELAGGSGVGPATKVSQLVSR